jgi:hypothetical protein
MIKIKLSVLSIILLSMSVVGCGGRGWHKAGTSRQDASNALAECKYQVGGNKSLIKRCMNAKGFKH